MLQATGNHDLKSSLSEAIKREEDIEVSLGNKFRGGPSSSSPVMSAIGIDSNDGNRR